MKNVKVSNFLFRGFKELFHFLGSTKISTVCLPVDFEKDETFEDFKATVAGVGNHLIITPLSPKGKMVNFTRY